MFLESRDCREYHIRATEELSNHTFHQTATSIWSDPFSAHGNCPQFSLQTKLWLWWNPVICDGVCFLEELKLRVVLCNKYSVQELFVPVSWYTAGWLAMASFAKKQVKMEAQAKSCKHYAKHTFLQSTSIMKLWSILIFTYFWFQGLICTLPSPCWSTTLIDSYFRALTEQSCTFKPVGASFSTAFLLLTLIRTRLHSLAALSHCFIHNSYTKGRPQSL